MADTEAAMTACTAGWCTSGQDCGNPAAYRTWWGGFLCERCRERYDTLSLLDPATYPREGVRPLEVAHG